MPIMRRVLLTELMPIPRRDPEYRVVEMTLAADGEPLLWSAERNDISYQRPEHYRFLLLENDSWRLWPEAVVEGVNPWLYPFIDGRIAVVSRWWSSLDDVPNAFIYSREGRRLAAFRVGHAVNDVQISSDGTIWVSYGDQQIGKGLEGFDANGRRIFDYQTHPHSSRMPSIVDSYALNVARGSDVSLYSYPDFPLTRFQDGDPIERWDASGVPGSFAFAIDGRYALFAGTYERPNSLFLLRLVDGAVEELQPVIENDEPLLIGECECTGRGTRLYVRDGVALRSIDLRKRHLW